MNPVAKNHHHFNLRVFCGIVLTIVIIFAAISIIGYLAFKNKADQFIEMGDIIGKSPDEIVEVVGNPSSITHLGFNRVLYQWIEASSFGGYHYAIQFNDDKCIGCTHQHRS